MSELIRVPDIGSGEGEIIELFVKVGDRIEADLRLLTGGGVEHAELTGREEAAPSPLELLDPGMRLVEEGGFTHNDHVDVGAHGLEAALGATGHRQLFFVLVTMGSPVGCLMDAL